MPTKIFFVSILTALFLVQKYIQNFCLKWPMILGFVLRESILAKTRLSGRKFSPISKFPRPKTDNCTSFLANGPREEYQGYCYVVSRS